jgi:hypothetical protein
MDPCLLAAHLDAQAVVADELALRLEILAAVVSFGARNLTIDLATRDVAVLNARWQRADSERCALVGGESLTETLRAAPDLDRTDLDAAARRLRRGAAAVDAAANRARACLGSRMATVDNVLNALDVGTDYDETGRRRIVQLTGRGAVA